jgi:hypothetical protein
MTRLDRAAVKLGQSPGEAVRLMILRGVEKVEQEGRIF